uniref:Uncharacterized protein n=1 Tax=Kalanchoe fedtschenkoi TaxID=63787 RepID=A0A7N0VEY2_KALFE
MCHEVRCEPSDNSIFQTWTYQDRTSTYWIDFRRVGGGLGATVDCDRAAVAFLTLLWFTRLGFVSEFGEKYKKIICKEMIKGLKIKIDVYEFKMNSKEGVHKSVQTENRTEPRWFGPNYFGFIFEKSILLFLPSELGDSSFHDSAASRSFSAVGYSVSNSATLTFCVLFRLPSASGIQKMPSLQTALPPELANNAIRLYRECLRRAKYIGHKV